MPDNNNNVSADLINSKLIWNDGDITHPFRYHDQKEEHPFEKIMRDVVMKDEFKKLLKEMLNEILDEREEKGTYDKLVKEFDIVIKRRKDGKKV
jgi:hypothetical protein